MRGWGRSGFFCDLGAYYPPLLDFSHNLEHSYFECSPYGFNEKYAQIWNWSFWVQEWILLSNFSQSLKTWSWPQSCLTYWGQRWAIWKVVGCPSTFLHIFLILYIVTIRQIKKPFFKIFSTPYSSVHHQQSIEVLLHDQLHHAMQHEQTCTHMTLWLAWPERPAQPASH